MKRMLDIVFSLIFLIVLSPLMLITSALVRIKLGTPVLFSQERPGKNAKIFRMYKLRTMTDAKDENGDLLPDCERITTFGRLLRSTSLDELPELFNILKGDMSFVGPRPLLVRYLPRYTKEQARRHEVRPGLTGWAQVNGRNAISWEKKFEMDVWYVDHRNIWLDLKIIIKTFQKVLARTDINQDGHDTTEEFNPEIMQNHSNFNNIKH